MPMGPLDYTLGFLTFISGDVWLTESNTSRGKVWDGCWSALDARVISRPPQWYTRPPTPPPPA